MWHLLRPISVARRISFVVESERLLSSSSSPSPIEMELRHGRPQLILPLPSRKERCLFTLLPLSHSVSDLVSMLRTEDKGIDRVVVRSVEGTRVAGATNIAQLLSQRTFLIEINDATFTIKTPEQWSVNEGDKQEDLQLNSAHKDLDQIRVLVSRLYSSLNVEESRLLKERELKAQRELLQSQLEPMERERALLTAKAERRASVLTWTGLGLMSVQFGILARLTWWEYSWDIMEPVTYFVTYGTGMACYAYFVLTRSDYVFPEVRQRQFLLGFHKQAQKKPWDVEKYNGLKSSLASVDIELYRLKCSSDLLQSYEGTSRSSSLPKADDAGANCKKESESNDNDLSHLESLRTAWRRPELK